MEETDENKEQFHEFLEIKQEALSEDENPPPVEENLVTLPTIPDEMLITYPHDVPDCWSETQCNNFKMINRWLLVKNGKLGCKACMNMQNWQTFDASEKGISNLRLPTVGWRTCEISYGGRTLETKQSSLRKKIFEHKNSKAHVQAVMMEENMSKIYTDQQLHTFKNEIDLDNLKLIFNSVYRIIKEKRLFYEFSKTCSSTIFQHISGKSLNPEKLFAAILSHIASELRKIIIMELLMKTKKIGLILYESGVISKNATLALHLKVIDENEIFSDDIGSMLFFDLIDLNSSSPEEVVVSLMNCLQKNNITKEFLRENLVDITFDENSLILGRNSKVGDTLAKFFPNIATRYNRNHTLETAINNMYLGIKNINFKELNKTTTMADAIFLTVVGPPMDQFNGTEMVKSWLNNEIDFNWPRRFLKKRTPKCDTEKKISNDMALAADNHDEERLVIDLKAEPGSQEMFADEQIDELSHTNSYDNSINDNEEVGNARKKKRTWRQMDKSNDVDRDVIERLIQQVREVSDLHAVNEDKDRLFLLSLLPFMKQLNTRENLEFRMEVQQILQTKLNVSDSSRNNEELA